MLTTPTPVSGPARSPLDPSHILQLVGSSVLSQSQPAFTQSARGTSEPNQNHAALNCRASNIAFAYLVLVAISEPLE